MSEKKQPRVIIATEKPLNLNIGVTLQVDGESYILKQIQMDGDPGDNRTFTYRYSYRCERV